MKQGILCAIARFSGKLMFAALKLNGSRAMMVVDPTTGDAPISRAYSTRDNWDKAVNVGEVLMEFPSQAWF